MTPEQQALAAGALLTGQLLGIGGDQWAVRRPTGGSLEGPAGPVHIGTWSGYIKRSRPTQLAAAAPGTPVGATEWHAIGASTTARAIDGSTLTLAVGDTLTSEADPTLRFAITAPYAVAGYARFILRQL